MRWSFRVAHIGGTDIRIHITFVLFLTWIAGAYYFIGGLKAAVDGVLFIPVLIGG